jgi:hypothetical protein
VRSSRTDRRRRDTRRECHVRFSCRSSSGHRCCSRSHVFRLRQSGPAFTAVQQGGPSMTVARNRSDSSVLGGAVLQLCPLVVGPPSVGKRPIHLTDSTVHCGGRIAGLVPTVNRSLRTVAHNLVFDTFLPHRPVQICVRHAQQHVRNARGISTHASSTATMPVMLRSRCPDSPRRARDHARRRCDRPASARAAQARRRE